MRFTAFATAIVCAIATPDVAFHSMGKFDLMHAAFPAVASFEGSETFLLVSSFGMFTPGSVYVVPNLKEAITGNTVSELKSIRIDTPNFIWPNVVEVIPHDVFNQRAIVVPDGFLVPGKNNGGVYVVTMSDSDITKSVETFQISSKKNGYFYHMGKWVDLNGDGRKDFLTARSNAKVDGGELVWFEHPAEGLTQSPWTEHVVTSGPDIGI